MMFSNKLLLFSTVVGVVLFGLFAAPGAHAGTGSCSAVKLNGSGVWFPVSMRKDGTGNLNGVFPDLARDILSTLDVPVEEGPDLPWKRALTLLEHGQIDVLAGAYKTVERLEKFGYSHPVMQEEVGVFVRKNLPDRPGALDDLKGLRGIAPFGASFGEEFDIFAADNLAIDRQPYDDFRTYMHLLMENRADYLIMARRDGLMLIREAGAEDLVVALPWSATVNTLHFLFSRATPCIGLLRSFNEELQRRINAGELDSLIKTYDPSEGDG